LASDSQIEEDMGDRLACQQKVITQRRLLEKRELDRDHQCQHCERKWEKETVEGIQGADGRKHKVAIELTDSGLSKKQRTWLAEKS
jgi:hypothetical protein